MADFGLPDLQSMRDVEGLVRFSKELAAAHIIDSVARITRPGAVVSRRQWSK